MTKNYLDKQGMKIIVDTLRNEMIKMQNNININTETLNEFNENLIFYGGSATDVMTEDNSS